MINRASTASRRRLSASMIRKAIADDLMQIKHEDGLTFDDIGRVLGKSADQAARYCDGTASMCAETYAFAREAWNGRFTGRLDALLSGLPDATCDRHKHSSILRASLAISIMLEDESIDDEEIRDNRKTLEEARDAIERLLSRIGPKRDTAA
jgi:hypothetical protein